MMEKKTKQHRNKKIITLSISGDAVGYLDEVSKSMGMSRSAFVEFIARQVIKADKEPFGKMLEDTLRMFMRKK